MPVAGGSLPVERGREAGELEASSTDALIAEIARRALKQLR
ncbi:hypothetical protein [Desulfovibrio sp.]|nr:hypothetical protein [Desulfovibrio sp.]